MTQSTACSPLRRATCIPFHAGNCQLPPRHGRWEKQLFCVFSDGLGCCLLGSLCLQPSDVQRPAGVCCASHLYTLRVRLTDCIVGCFVCSVPCFHLLQSEYETPHGRIDLSSCMTVKSAEQKTSKRNALEVSTPDTTYFMYANTEKVRRRLFAAHLFCPCVQYY